MAAEVAQLYAEAMFELYRESGDDDTVYSQLNEYLDVFESNPELTQLLAAPLLTLEEKISVASKVFRGEGIVFDFLCLLCEKNRADHFCEIIYEFNKKYNEYKNIADVTVITSVQLSDELRGRLKAKLEKQLSKTVILKEKTDPSIIDGIIVEYDNKRLDSSVRSRLEGMRDAAADAGI